VETGDLSPSPPEKSSTEVEPKVVGEGEDLPPKSKNIRKKRRSRRFLWAFIGILLVVIVAAVGSWFGYQSGLQMRLDQEYDQIAMAAVTQFQLGLEDESAGRFEMARQRYEYVIRLDPNFPGAQERLTEVMLYMAETAVPTIAPTATPIPVTPTPDTRDIEEKFNNAMVLLQNREWDNAIAMAELVRREDIEYRSADIDGIMYVALRFRGIQKILNGSLEPGIYDLTLSEHFAPLDNEAEGLRSWARYYLTGSSFWEIDWASVVEIFGEIYPYLPNLRDGSGWTAQERYRVGSIHYADQLAQEGKWCDARHYYQQALSLAADEKIFPTATAIQLLCEPPKPTATQTPEVTATPEITSTPEFTPTTQVVPTEDLQAICCPPTDPDNPDPRCETFTCPAE
jgi:tetratricopeptide (TPR) repeat protein